MDESDNTESPSLKMSNMNMNEDIDALAVHEADQILSNPQPQTDFPSILSPLSPDNDVTTQVGASGECIPEGKHVDASLDALPAIYEGLTKSESYSTSSVIQCPAQAPISLLGQCEFPDNQDQDEDQEIDSSQTAGAKAQSQGGTVNTPEVKNEEVNQTDDESPPGHLPCQFPDEKLEFPEGKEHITDQDEIQSEFGGEQASHHSESSLVRNDTEMPVSAEIDDPGYDQDHLSWGEMFGKGMFIVTFVALTLLAYGGSGLLPLSLVDNPVKSIWHSSKYHEQSITLLSGMKGLWAQESTHSYVDVQIVVLRGLEIMNSIRRSSSKAQKEVHTYLQVAISVVDDWKKVLMQHNLFGKNPNVDLEQEDRGRQFEWIQDLQFEEEWLDEAPPYTDWELLHEYDLGAANEFILASVPEPLKDNLRKNFSRLSDSFEVQGLLEELMRLKGGDTEEDRLEVLQYFWEYTRFSASAHKTLANYHNEQKGMEDEDIQLDSYSGPSSENLPDETSGGVEEPVTVSAAPQSGTAFVDELDLGSVRSQDQQGHPKDEEADFSPAAAVQEIEIEKQISQLDHSVNEFDSNSALFEMNQEIYLEKQVGLELGPASSESSQSIEELGSSIALLELQQNFETKNGGFDVEKKSSHAFYTDVGRKNQNSDGHFDVCQQTTKEHIHEAESTKAEPYAVIPLITALITLSALAIIVGLARSRKLNDAAKLVPPLSKHVEFLQKSLHMQGNVEDEIIYPSSKLLADSNGDKQDITMIEELNERFASVLRSPEPSLSGRLSSVAKGEDSSRSPVPVPSASSPYGSFTTYKLVSKKEGQAMETKLTPVRRSSRIRNHANISPKVDALKRVAISPP
ncbi:hypothetical protein KP509_11G094500 [Ceratopteris richardii]|nr:hypothetical protein KP509_11G094500 [Ceratopteris richardii]